MVPDGGFLHIQGLPALSGAYKAVSFHPASNGMAIMYS